MAALDPLASGLLSILAAGLAAAGTLYQGLQRQQVERDKEQRAAEKAIEAREMARMEKAIEALQIDVKAMRERDHQQDLAQLATQRDLAHMRGTLDEALVLLRQLAGPPALRSTSTSTGGE